MSVEKTRRMFLDGENYARGEVTQVYGTFLYVDWDNPPTDYEMAVVFSAKKINELKVYVPEGADKQYYYGIQYYLEMMQSEIKRLRNIVENPSCYVRVTF